MRQKHRFGKSHDAEEGDLAPNRNRSVVFSLRVGDSKFIGLCLIAAVTRRTQLERLSGPSALNQVGEPADSCLLLRIGNCSIPGVSQGYGLHNPIKIKGILARHNLQTGCRQGCCRALARYLHNRRLPDKQRGRRCATWNAALMVHGDALHLPGRGRRVRQTTKEIT